MSTALPHDLGDITEYTFRAPPAVGSRVTVRSLPAVGPGELVAAAQAYAHTAADLLAAEGVAVAPAEGGPGGPDAVTITARLPAEPGQPGGGATLRAAFVRLPGGRAVHVEFVARADDPQADGQFREVLRTLRPAAGGNPLADALESVAAAADVSPRPAGPVTFDLPPQFRGPAAAVLATPDRATRLEVAVREVESAPHPLFGQLATAAGDDGRPVRYQVAPTRPAAAEALESPAPAPAAAEVLVKGRRLRVTASVAGDAQAARELVRSVVARSAP